jgi:hypothetical protein
MSRIYWSAFLAVACAFPVGCQNRDSTPASGSTPAGRNTYHYFKLGRGQVGVTVPADYPDSTELPELTLVLTPPNDPGVTLRFNLHYFADGPADVGVQFVREEAKKKNLSVTEKGGKVIMTETSNGDEKGVKVERRFWQIGFQNAVVVMSATVVASKKNDAAVKECLEKTVPSMIDSLKKI